jgi:hypothetical protein
MISHIDEIVIVVSLTLVTHILYWEVSTASFGHVRMRDIIIIIIILTIISIWNFGRINKNFRHNPGNSINSEYNFGSLELINLTYVVSHVRGSVVRIRKL